MNTIALWLIVLMTNTGHRIELPNQYVLEKDCLNAAEAIPRTQPGMSATCVRSAVVVSEERAKDLATEEWWRTRPPEPETVEKEKR